MKIKVGSWGEYEFDRQDAEIVIPLILLLLGLFVTPLRKEYLLGAAVAYYALIFFLPPIFRGLKALYDKVRHWFKFRCPYCKSHELVMQGLQEFHGDIPYEWYFCHRCRETSVYVNTFGAEKMIAPNAAQVKAMKEAKRELAD